MKLTYGRIQILLWLISGLMANPVLALPSDHQQPITIEADRADIDDQKGISIYRGNVTLVQGAMELKCNVLTAHHASDARALAKIIAEGTPVYFRQRPAADKEEVIATAPRMEYLVNKQLVYLLEKAEVTQGRNVFRGQRIEYNINDNQVHAESGTSPGERVRVTLFPQEKGKKDNLTPSSSPERKPTP